MDLPGAYSHACSGVNDWSAETIGWKRAGGCSTYLSLLPAEEQSMIYTSFWHAVMMSAVFAITLRVPARAQDFFKDKTLTFIVGYSPGGTYDQYTRLLARHIGKHVSGNRTRVVENMPGAGGIIAANHLYNRVKPGGLTIAAWASPLILQQIMGNDATKFDARKVGWIGIPGPYDPVCQFNRESGIKTVDEWFASKRPMKNASIGPGTSLSDVPKLLKEALNLPLD